MLKISLFGEFSIKADKGVIKGIFPQRVQSLLAYLVLHADAPQNRSHLAFLFWPETNEKQARTNLRNLLHQLKRALPMGETYIDSNNLTIQWRPDSEYVLDVKTFKNAISDAETASRNYELENFRQELEKAIAVYQGDLLPNCYNDWITPLRESLRHAYITALEQLIHLLEEKQDYISAIDHAQRLIQYDPLLESTYQCLIRLHALNNDRASALRVYHNCETILRRELDVEPSPLTREGYQKLLSNEARPYSSQSTTSYFPVVGREHEWSQMRNAWRALNQKKGPSILILSGEAGIGKTRLIEEMSQWVSRQGFANASSRCYSVEGKLAYSPIITWLRSQEHLGLDDIWLTEIARLLPEITSSKPGLPKPGLLTEEWQRTRLFESISRAILQIKQPFLLTIDDLQWCDQDTLDWLHFFLHFDRNARRLILAAFRPEEIGKSHPLERFLRALRADGSLGEINLSPLGEGATQKLASVITGVEISQSTGHYLFQQTEGNPLFLVEMLQTGISLGVALESFDSAKRSFVDPRVDTSSLPTRVHSILKARLGQLSQGALDLACLASAIGREFSFNLLLKASGLEEISLVNYLDELWRRRIIREQGVDAYDFSHDKLREVAYEGMSSARRKQFHRQIAKALAAIHTSDLASVSHLVAAHYEHGGLPEQAIPYYLQAAENARKIYANQEAKGFIQKGLKITEAIGSLAGEKNGLVGKLWEALGDLLILSAEHEHALDAFHNARKWVLPSARIDQARLYRKIAETYRDQRDYLKTLEACDQAETLLGKKPHGDFDQWWDEWIDVQIEKVWAYYWSARWQDLEELVDRISLVVKVRASAPSRMRFLKASCLTNLRKYRYFVTDEMLENSKENLAASREYGSLQTQTESLFELGFLYLWRHQLDQAEEYLKDSLALTESTGNLLFHTLCLTYLTVLHRFQGELQKVHDFAMLTIEAAKNAHMPDYTAAAKANLAWLALQKGDLIDAQRLSQEALDLWQESPLVYPFQWMALWPKIGVALAENREEDVRELFRSLLVPTQQILPKDLGEAIQFAVQEHKLISDEDRLLGQGKIVEIAKSMGYL
jgi:DNA-binding SARP family transcriptional activator